MNRRAMIGLGLPACFGLAAAKPLRNKMMPWRARTIDGENLTGDTLLGKVLLIQYWATWCKYCQRDEPALETLLTEFGSKGLVVLAINANEDRAKVKEYLAAHKRTAKIAHVADTNLGKVFGSMGVPAYLLIDREGRVVTGQEGSGGILSLREMLKEVELTR
jgi:thiol-disulfide isomerase/thioredoxin